MEGILRWDGLCCWKQEQCNGKKWLLNAPPSTQPPVKDKDPPPLPPCPHSSMVEHTIMKYGIVTT